MMREGRTALSVISAAAATLCVYSTLSSAYCRPREGLYPDTAPSREYRPRSGCPGVAAKGRARRLSRGETSARLGDHHSGLRGAGADISGGYRAARAMTHGADAVNVDLRCRRAYFGLYGAMMPASVAVGGGRCGIMLADALPSRPSIIGRFRFKHRRSMPSGRRSLAVEGDASSGHAQVSNYFRHGSFLISPPISTRLVEPVAAGRDGAARDSGAARLLAGANSAPITRLLVIAYLLLFTSRHFSSRRRLSFFEAYLLRSRLCLPRWASRGRV